MSHANHGESHSFEENFKYYSILCTAGELELRLGKLDEAEVKLIQTKEEGIPYLGQYSEIYLNCLMNIGNLYSMKQDYKKSIEQHIEVNELLEVSEKDETGLYADNLYNLGFTYLEVNHLTKADSAIAKANFLYKKLHGIESVAYIRSLQLLGWLNQNMSEYDKAEDYLLIAIRLGRKVYGENSADFAVSLANLGILYRILHRCNESDKLLIRAKKIYLESFGEHSRYYLQTLTQLGVLYRYCGSYSKSEEYHLMCKRLMEKYSMVEDMNYVRNLNMLGVLYSVNMGKYIQAEKCFNQALSVTRQVLSENHVEYAGTLHNMGLMYHYSGNLNKALDILIEAKDKFKNISGVNSFEYATILGAIAQVQLERDEHDLAKDYLDEAKKCREELLGESHPATINVIYQYGLLNLAKENYDLAEEYFNEAKSEQENILGNQHQEYLNTLYRLSKVNWLKGESEKVIENWLEIHSNLPKYISKHTLAFSSSELQKFKSKYNDWYSFYSSFLMGYNENNRYSDLYDYLLTEKNLIVDYSNFVNLSREFDDLKQADLFNELKAIKYSLANEYSKPIVERIHVDSLKNRANILEKAIAKRLGGISSISDNNEMINNAVVANALNKKEVAIEFFYFDIYNPNSTDSVMYAALLLRPGDEQPHFIPLFEERQLKALLDKKGDNDNSYYTNLYSGRADTSLYGLIWQPLDSLLEGVDKIYASPSGLLHRLNLGAIMSDADHTFADRYALSILGSTRQLVIKKDTPENQNLTAAVYGGIRYEMDSTAIASNLEGGLDTMQFYDGGELSFSYVERSTPQRGRSWDYLPGTDKEAEAITNLIGGQEGEVSSYQGYAATEESVKAIGQDGSSPRILHIATHGYFYPDPEEKVKQSVFYERAPAFKISDHPMIRSGLIMAGGNHTWKGNPPLKGWEDGILTAYEVSQLDLRNTELAVLSACETGLGDIEGNEGVYGLQRAFRIAGVDKLIMSLWSVPDEQTQEMMVLFYDNWLKEGMEIEVAFRAAQREMRERYEAHYYWASFVLIK